MMTLQVWKENIMFFYLSHVMNPWVPPALSAVYDGGPTSPAVVESPLCPEAAHCNFEQLWQLLMS